MDKKSVQGNYLFSEFCEQHDALRAMHTLREFKVLLRSRRIAHAYGGKSIKRHDMPDAPSTNISRRERPMPAPCDAR